jgi:hypothetical protein
MVSWWFKKVAHDAHAAACIAWQGPLKKLALGMAAMAMIVK